MHAGLTHANPQQPRAVLRHRVTTLFTVNHSNPKLIHSVHGVVSFSYDSDTMPHRAEWCAATKYGDPNFKKTLTNGHTGFAHRFLRCTVVSRAHKRKEGCPGPTLGSPITRSDDLT